MVDNILSNIKEIKTLVKNRYEITSQINSLSKPILFDTSVVRTMYNEVCRFYNVPKLTDTNRDAFVFAMYALYSPLALSGNKHKGKIRKCLADIFQIYPNSISPKWVMLYYERYEPFREQVKSILTITLTVVGR